jgi:hypothetical protein
MPRDPTIEDFADWVQSHLDKAIKSAHDACEAVQRQHNAQGRLRSGNTIIRCFDAAYGEFDKGVNAALGALGVAEERGVLDGQQLRETTERLLAQFISDMKHACKAPLFRQWGLLNAKVLDEREDEFGTKARFALRHFDVGHLNPVGPEVPASISNEIKVENMIGSVVQQGTTDSTQNASITINIAAVQNALGNLEKTLSEYPAPPEIAAEIEPELQTIKAQLAKPKPTFAILREAGSTLRSISEGVAGGLLAPHVLSAIGALLSALGIQ